MVALAYVLALRQNAARKNFQILKLRSRRDTAGTMTTLYRIHLCAFRHDALRSRRGRPRVSHKNSLYGVQCNNADRRAMSHRRKPLSRKPSRCRDASALTMAPTKTTNG